MNGIGMRNITAWDPTSWERLLQSHQAQQHYTQQAHAWSSFFPAPTPM
jgi:hypothetical protein